MQGSRSVLAPKAATGLNFHAPSRLIMDKELGNLIKVDRFG
jgi:hypothetical protein